MAPLVLHNFHASHQARFTQVNGLEVVDDYGSFLSEHAALRDGAGVLDLGFRGRLVLAGTDRLRFLNGQVTNNLKELPAGEGAYAALVNNKGRIQSDLNIFILPDEILLDFEPGLTAKLTERFNRFIIADDVQLIDAAPHYGLLSVQGPRARSVLERLKIDIALPEREYQSRSAKDEILGEVYCMNVPRTGSNGFDLFAPVNSLEGLINELMAAAKAIGGIGCGWRALETARIEAGIPRFGSEMDETNLVPETGIESRAVSYTKGCYIGQEVIARIRTYGKVAKALRGLRMSGDSAVLPEKGDKLFFEDREIGYLCSAIHSPALNSKIGLGYVRREHNQIGSNLRIRAKNGEVAAKIVELPFVRQAP